MGEGGCLRAETSHVLHTPSTVVSPGDPVSCRRATVRHLQDRIGAKQEMQELIDTIWMEEELTGSRSTELQAMNQRSSDPIEGGKEKRFNGASNTNEGTRES